MIFKHPTKLIVDKERIELCIQRRVQQVFNDGETGNIISKETPVVFFGNLLRIWSPVK